MTTYRVVVVGCGGVGKSALSVRYVQGNYVEIYDPTIEANYRKQVDIGEDVCLLDILDTAGQDEYSVLREQYMRMGDGFLLVYSVTSPQTFATIIKFHAQAMRYARAKPAFVLVGNKSDCEEDRAITAQEGRDLAAGLQCPFFETSARLDTNVSEAFLALVSQMHAARAQSPGADAKRERRRLRFQGHNHCSLL